MAIGVAPKLDTLFLSSGQNFVQKIPLFRAQTYPSGTTAQIVIRNGITGSVIATWDGEIAGTSAMFNEDNLTTLNAIPHGSKFDLFVNYSDGRIVKQFYGMVVRAENRF